MSRTRCRRVASIPAPAVLVLLIVFMAATASAADKKFEKISRECSGKRLKRVDCDGDCGTTKGVCAEACAADPACGAYETDADEACDLLERCDIAITSEYSDFDAYVCTTGCPPGGPDYQMYRNDFWTCNDDGLLDTYKIRGCHDDNDDDTDSKSLDCTFEQCAERCRKDSDCNKFVVRDDVTKCALYSECTYGDYDFDHGEYRGEMIRSEDSSDRDSSGGDVKDSSDSSGDAKDSSDSSGDAKDSSDSSGDGKDSSDSSGDAK